MSKLNKLVTNYPVTLSEEEVENLSATLAPVVAACGGGGGTGGKIYNGIGFVNVNNSTNQIGLTEAANTKLNQDIPTKVSDLSDSANYQTVAGMDEYLTTANAASTYQTKDAMSAYWTYAETTEVFAEELSTLVGLINGKQDKLTFAYDNDKISAINGSALAGQGGVTGDYYSASNPSGFITSSVGELDNFYSKTDTSSKTELQTKFDSLLDYNVTAAAGIQVTTATDAGIKTFGISMTAEPVVTDTRLSGYNGVAAALDTNVSGLWNVGLTHDMLNTINGKLDSTVAAETYQPIGNYLSSNALDGYATTALLDTISSKIENDIPSIAGLATETDLQNVSAGVDYVSGALTGYQITGDYIVTGDILTATNNKLTGIKIGNTDYTIPTTDLTNYYTKSETSGTEQLSTEFAKYLTKTQYNTDSATFALKTDLNDLVSSASVTTNDNYVMTNTGWKVLTLPGGGMTQVYHDTTLTGDGNANDNKLGVKWETLSSNTIAYSNSAFNLTNGTSVSSFDQISAAIDDRYSKSSSDGRYLRKSLDNTLTGDGTDNKKLGVAWSALSSNKIDSAKSANSAEGLTNGTAYSGFDDISAAFGNLSSYLPTSGGTVSGQLEVHGGSNFDTQFIKLTREGNSCGARIGLGNDTTNGTLALKTFNSQGQNTVQVNIKHNTNNNELIQVQKGGSDIGFLIPAVTATTTDGLTDDGILHIILES